MIQSGLFDNFPFPTAMFNVNHTRRYVLSRRWDDDLSIMGAIGLNPSTADERFDDPTVRRWTGFAKRDGFGSLVVGNIYSWRATDPKDLLAIQDPVDPFNDHQLERIGQRCHTVLLSWGNPPLVRMDSRAQDVLEMAKGWPCRVVTLGLTMRGNPKHPLYLSAKTPMVEIF